MLDFSSLLALIGLLLVLYGVFLLGMQKNRKMALASFITGILLVLLPSAWI